MRALSLQRRCRRSLGTVPTTATEWGATFDDDEDDDDDCFYIALFFALKQTHCARMWFYMSDQLFIAHFLIIHRSSVLRALAWLVPHETAAVSARSVYTIQPCNFMQSRICKVYAYFTSVSHLFFKVPFHCSPSSPFAKVLKGPGYSSPFAKVMKALGFHHPLLKLWRPWVFITHC